jgi:Na+/H+ antiporter NhaD/arsenite permease-like protein
MNKVTYFFGLIAATAIALYLARFGGMFFNASQVASILIFSTFIYGTLLFGEFRLAFAFGGIALLMAFGLLDVPGFTEAANLKVIVFLIGMFLVIGFLEENQFFEHIVSMIVARVGPRPKSLLLVLMIMATISAALVDEVTSILFMTGTMLHLTSKYRLNPVPFVIMLVFATNIGSAMSAIGNPIGVMIALNAPFSFVDFLRWSAPIALVVNVVTYFICRWWFADSFKAFAGAVAAEHSQVQARAIAKSPVRELVMAGGGGGGGDGRGAGEDLVLERAEEGSKPVLGDDFYAPGESNEIDGFTTDQSTVVCWIVFLFTIGLLVTHGLTEKLFGTIFHVVRETHADGSIVYGLKEGTMMIGAALFMGGIVLLIRREKARELVERRVDWWTLSFFMMLFASVGTLEHTGVTGVIAQKLISSTGGNQFLLINIVGWATGWLSAFLDNVLAVATFMPVVHDVRLHWAAQNPANAGYPEAIYWLMLFGGTFMGNMTVIGSTANIIATGMLEKRGHGTVSFLYWFKIGVIVSIASMAVATVLLGLQTHWFTTPLLAVPQGAAITSH